ncbi:ABC transporter ATP-binding protein [Thermodesulfobacteriota bacterium]
MKNDMTQAVSIRGLNKDYGKVTALKDLDLAIDKGLIYGLLGPNGAGKSTLIKALVGVVKANSGLIEVLGRKIPNDVKIVRRRLGYMPQTPALYGDLSVKSNIKFFAGAHGLEDIKDRVDHILDFVGLGNISNRKVFGLSGGLKQRCSLACALVHNPELLILDEPTAGVDPVLKEGFWKYFRQLRSEGVTIIISTHLMDEPLACDRIGILREGRLLIEDTPENILSKGKTELTLEGDMGSITEKVSDYSRDLPRLLKPYGLRSGISSISLKQDSLEEIFLKLVRVDNKHD